jgi:mRNA-degrading endonuclease toxin of MazEF toxin-antitoxin module
MHADFFCNLPLSEAIQYRTLSIERIGSRIGRATAEEMTQIVDGLNEIIGN